MHIRNSFNLRKPSFQHQIQKFCELHFSFQYLSVILTAAYFYQFQYYLEIDKKKINYTGGRLGQAPSMVLDLILKDLGRLEIGDAFKTGYDMVVCGWGWGQFCGVLAGLDNEQFKLLVKMRIGDQGLMIFSKITQKSGLAYQLFSLFIFI